MNKKQALELALKWASAGVPAFPISLTWSEEKQSINKVPLTQHGFKDATTDETELRRLFDLDGLVAGSHNLGVGLRPGPGGYIVLDVDVKGNADGLGDIKRLQEAHGWPGHPMRVSTASGGLHYWFRRPYEEPIGNTAIAPGVDIRADAGFVVAPGTTSTWGDWTRDEDSYRLNEATELAPAWAALLNQRTASGERVPIAERLTVGQRHAGLTRMAGAMRRQGAGEAEILSALRVMNAERCDPPKGDDDLVALAKSVVELYEPEPDVSWPVALKGKVLGGPQPAAVVHYDDKAAGLEPLDLAALLAGDRPAEDWLVKPILPIGKLVGFVSKRGVGKSLLLFDVACKLASGQPALQQDAAEPVHVIYIDMEMGSDDVYARLEDLEWSVNHPLMPTLNEHLHYYQLAGLPPLDTERGGDALEALVERHSATLVIVDTVSRVISGNENDADPFREMFRWTESRLKRRGVTYARLDHLGKDATLGSRGSSAKEDPLDVIWHVDVNDLGHLDLKLTKGRVTWLRSKLQIQRKREDDTTSTHFMLHEPEAEWLSELVEIVDELGLPSTAGRAAIRDALAEAGVPSRSNNKLAEVARFRRHRGGER